MAHEAPKSAKVQQGVIQEIAEINLTASKNKADIKGSSSNQGVVEVFENEIETITDEIQSLRDLNSNLNSTLATAKWGTRTSIKNQIQENNLKIKSLEEKRTTVKEKLIAAKKDASADTAGAMGIVDEDKEARLKPKLAELEIINKAITDLQERQKNINIDADKKDEKEKAFEERKLELIKEIDDQAPDNQVFRVALWFKDWFEVDYSKEIADLEQRILKLEKSKISDTYFSNWFLKKIFFFIKKENTAQDNAVIDRNILRLEKQIKDYEEKMNFTDISETTESVYADLPRAALTAAFWLWFGVLSFIISVTGTMLAFASLVLLDPRLHVIRNKPGANWKGVARRISGFFVVINKYIWGRVKRLKDPKIIEKEVEVEKVVEKIVEKNVGEKIRFEKIEVPKEVVRKEIVYVPLPTDDTDILKKGPFSVPDEESLNPKDKSKK